jgi:hypothetical protein
MVMGAPLEDAHHLAQRYDRMCQEAEAQVISLCITLMHNDRRNGFRGGQ